MMFLCILGNEIGLCIWSNPYISNPKLHESWKLVRTATFLHHSNLHKIAQNNYTCPSIRIIEISICIWRFSKHFFYLFLCKISHPIPSHLIPGNHDLNKRPRGHNANLSNNTHNWSGKDYTVLRISNKINLAIIK